MSVRDNYTMINIREYLALGSDEDVGEPALVRLLSDFSCPKNPDVEKLLKYYSNNRFSRFDTRQIISKDQEPHELVQLLRLL